MPKVPGFVKKGKKNYSSLQNIFWQKKTCYKPSENSSSKWLQTRVWKTSLPQSTSCKISLLWLVKILAWNCPRSLWLEVRVLENQVFWKASLESKFCIKFFKSRFKMMGISKAKLFSFIFISADYFLIYFFNWRIESIECSKIKCTGKFRWKVSFAFNFWNHDSKWWEFRKQSCFSFGIFFFLKTIY